MKILIQLVLILSLLMTSFLKAEDGKSKLIEFEICDLIKFQTPRSSNATLRIFNNARNHKIFKVDKIDGLNKAKFANENLNNIGYRISFNFYAPNAGRWEFELAYDAGIASVFFIDDKKKLSKNFNIYAQYHEPTILKVNLSEGWHSFEYYGLEDCCDGLIRFRFKSPDDDEFKVISYENLELK